MNLSGSLATSAARSSLGKPNPICSSSAETDAYTIAPTRNFVCSLIRCSEVRGSDIAIRRTSSRVAMAGQPARLGAPALAGGSVTRGTDTWPAYRRPPAAGLG